MIVGVVGLGLIGGSFAKGYHSQGNTVYAYDRDTVTLDFSILGNVVDAPLTKENISECDLVVIAIYPDASIEYLRSMAPYIGSKPLVIDACGTKRAICEAGFALAEEHGFTFVGCHPMAGTKFSGYKYSRSDMFRAASMVVVPPTFDDIQLLARVKELLNPLGFNKYSITTAEDHDRMIAFTSQLSHLVASSYIKSPSAERQRGFAGGSYRDMTRVAFLNPNMWAEIFISNKDYLMEELDSMINNLTQYREAISEERLPELKELLADGSKRKETFG